MPLFTKRHYQWLAMALSVYRPNDKDLETYHRMLVNFLANGLAVDNPNFNKEKFLEACGVKQAA